MRSGGKPCFRSPITHRKMLRACGLLQCCAAASVEGPGAQMASGDDVSFEVVTE